MTVAEFVVQQLIDMGVTDTFGIPGGVVIDLLYAINDRKPTITPHLSYHEQAAGFAACGYAQSSGKLGVAYATRGPGFTNLMTPMADAFFDSIPVVFITAHSRTESSPEGMRTMVDQELDSCTFAQPITKLAAYINTVEDVLNVFPKACKLAVSGRKGPVFVDFYAPLWKMDIPFQKTIVPEAPSQESLDMSPIVRQIQQTQRPVLLLGDGIHQTGLEKECKALIKHLMIPVISSRFSHDIAGDDNCYYGYIGSHGIRCANFILSKADLIISLGNRMHYPVQSQSFRCMTHNKTILQFDIDEGEFLRKIPNSIPYHYNIKEVVQGLLATESDFGEHTEWLRICNIIHSELKDEDCSSAVSDIAALLKKIPDTFTLVNDVGNNEFWVSRACILNKQRNRTLYSKSFGALGSSIGKAIGAYFSTRQPVICFIGDQGFQMNVQELQFIAQHQLPIAIVVINNNISGMMKDRELATGHDTPLHTTKDSGYLAPDLNKLANAYGIQYLHFNKLHNNSSCLSKTANPLLIELPVDSNLSLSPSLPKQNDCQNLTPYLDSEKYNYLNLL